MESRLNGLPDWTDQPPILAFLGSTPFSVAEGGWLGRPVLDRHAEPFGRVRDLLVQCCPSEEAGGGPGVRAVYAVVATRQALPWRRPRDLLLPLSSLRARDEALHTCRDAADLWLTLFGQARRHA
jgi:hypothetical protein